MAISIKRNAQRSEGRKPLLPRSFLTVLALVQLPVTLMLIVFAFTLITSFKNQGLQLTQIGPYVAITDTFESIRAYRFPVRHWLGIAEEMPVVNLDIKQENYRALEYASLRDQALLEGKVDGDSLRREVFVKAKLREGSETYPVKVRLKGDRRIHWANPETWSFRVEVRGDQSVFGMRRFSLQKPVSRNYVYEWFFHRLLKREELIGLRYDFVHLNVNGKSQGVYAVEEHFDKILLESNDRREAPILRFAEVGMGLGKDWYQMTVSPYGKKRWSERNPEMLRQATNLLEDFQYGRKTAAEVFDIDLLARYYAIVDLTDSFHAGLAKSIKFYFNPVNRKLEPIGFDAQFNDRKFPVLIAELSDFRKETGYANPAYYERMFGGDIRDNIQLWEAYTAELERMADPAYLDELFEEIGPELEEKLDAIYAETPWQAVISGHPLTTGARFWFYFGEQKFYERQSMIRKRLYPRAAVTSYLEESDEDGITVQIANGQKLPIEIVEVYFNGQVYRAKDRILLSEKPRYAPMAFQSYEFELVGSQPARAAVKPSLEPVTIEQRDSVVRYRVPGTKGISEHDLFNWKPSVLANPNEMEYNRYSQIEAQRFFDIDEDQKLVSIKPGFWQIDSDVVVPGGYTLVARPGTAIDLINGARIVSYSKLDFQGSETDPITFTTSDGTGKGIIVLEAPERSLMRHARFDGLFLADGEPWTLTSVVTFHRSDVDIYDCFFGNNDSEDSLNIIRSDFLIDSSTFRNTRGDAFDGDFSTGTVQNSRYLDIGNDAIDVSGSRLVVRNVTVNGAGDKGISVGEASRMEAEYVTLMNVNMAVAGKDLSFFEAQELRINGANVGFALFQKKPEYGPATASVWRTSMSNIKEDYWLEVGSNLIWDGLPVESNREGLKYELYADEYVPDKPPEAAPEQ